MYTHMYICMYICIYICIYIYIYVCIHTSICDDIFIFTLLTRIKMDIKSIDICIKSFLYGNKYKYAFFYV
jgi:hypothetical protein